MLRLIVAHRYNRGLIEQNIGGHQHRVLQQAIADRFLRGRFGFELGHPFEPAERRDARQHPGQFRMRGNGGLHHNA